MSYVLSYRNENQTLFKGFTGDGFECTDVDECALNMDICDKSRSRCNNTIGDYNCICAGGFTQELTDAKRCVDIDECVWDIEVCPGENQICVNKVRLNITIALKPITP